MLEALGGYLVIAERLLDGDKQVATAFNFGPSDDDTQPVSWVVERMLDSWGGGEWVKPEGAQPHEATLLRLDCSKARAELGWKPRFRLQDALDKVVEWHKACRERRRRAGDQPRPDRRLHGPRLGRDAAPLAASNACQIASSDAASRGSVARSSCAASSSRIGLYSRGLCFLSLCQ